MIDHHTCAHSLLISRCEFEIKTWKKKHSGFLQVSINPWPLSKFEFTSCFDSEEKHVLDRFSVFSVNLQCTCYIVPLVFIKYKLNDIFFIS